MTYHEYPAKTNFCTHFGAPSHEDPAKPALLSACANPGPKAGNFLVALLVRRWLSVNAL
jgi:hypothetical protein